MAVKYIHIHDSIASSTCDTDLLTADTDLLTVDVTATGYILEIPYRVFSATPVVKWHNELTGLDTTTTETATASAGIMKLAFGKTFLEGDSFSIQVYTTDEQLIWQGRLYASGQTSTQDFKLGGQNDIIYL